jgi:hypothetical protein
MKKPICKLCGKPHWTYEDHASSETEVPGYVKEMALGAMGHEKRIVTFPDENPPETTTTATQNVPTSDCPHVMSPPPGELSPQCACGKPRDGRHSSCAACRKRAYRERKEAAS